MQSDRDKWNKRYADQTNDCDRQFAYPAAPECIRQSLTELPSGQILDLACGDGAVSLLLASKGYQVSAADISDQALEKLSRFAIQQNLQITTLEIDFDEPASLSDLAPFDGIVISRYKPPVSLWPVLADCLRNGGILIIATFNHQHHLKNGFSERYCLKDKELVAIHPALELVRHRAIEEQQNHLDEYIFRKISKAHSCDR